MPSSRLPWSHERRWAMVGGGLLELWKLGLETICRTTLNTIFLPIRTRWTRILEEYCRLLLQNEQGIKDVERRGLVSNYSYMQKVVCHLPEPPLRMRTMPDTSVLADINTCDVLHLQLCSYERKNACLPLCIWWIIQKCVLSLNHSKRHRAEGHRSHYKSDSPMTVLLDAPVHC